VLFARYIPQPEDNLPEEKRISPRFALQVPITLSVPDRGLRAHGTTRDISGGGIFLYADAPVQAFDEIELQLVLPYQISSSEIRVACRAKVLRLEQKNGSTRGIAAAIQTFDFLHE